MIDASPVSTSAALAHLAQHRGCGSPLAVPQSAADKSARTGELSKSEPLWKRGDDWVGSEIEDAFVMVNIDNGKYVALNLTATAVWEAMATPVDQTEIERVMCSAYSVSVDDCHRSVTALLKQMQELQLAHQS